MPPYGRDSSPGGVTGAEGLIPSPHKLRRSPRELMASKACDGSHRSVKDRFRRDAKSPARVASVAEFDDFPFG